MESNIFPTFDQHFMQGCSPTHMLLKTSSVLLFKVGKPALWHFELFSVHFLCKFLSLLHILVVHWTAVVCHESLLSTSEVCPELKDEQQYGTSSSFHVTFQLHELEEAAFHFWCRSPVCSALCHTFGLALAKRVPPLVARSFVSYLPLSATAAMATFSSNATKRERAMCRQNGTDWGKEAGLLTSLYGSPWRSFFAL